MSWPIRFDQPLCVFAVALYSRVAHCRSSGQNPATWDFSHWLTTSLTGGCGSLTLYDIAAAFRYPVCQCSARIPRGEMGRYHSCVPQLSIPHNQNSSTIHAGSRMGQNNQHRYCNIDFSTWHSLNSSEPCSCSNCSNSSGSHTALSNRLLHSCLMGSSHCSGWVLRMYDLAHTEAMVPVVGCAAAAA